jgi:hypothetical protein
MANNFEIKSNDLVSTMYAGQQKSEDKPWWADFFKGIEALRERLTPQWIKDFFISVEMFKNDPRGFMDGWVSDSPIGAAAGVLAAGLSGGLLLIVGGTAVGMVGRAGIGAIAKITTLTRVLGGALAGLGSFIKWGWGLAGVIFAGWTISKLIQFSVSGASFLFNFNWNVTDAQIEQQQKSLLTNIYRQAGAAIGATVGTLVCGTLPAQLLEKNAQKLKIDPNAIAEIKYLSLTTNGFEYGEIYDEMFESLSALVSVTSRSLITAIFLESYKNIRRCVKWLAKATFIDKIPGLGDAIKKWGEEGSQSWSFASQLEEWVDTIEDTSLREFTEEFLEEFMEVCSENLMIIAGATS